MFSRKKEDKKDKDVQSKGDKEGTDAQQSKGDKEGTDVQQSKGDEKGTEQPKGDKQSTEQSKGDKQGTDTQQSKGDKQGTEQSKGDKEGTDVQQSKGDKEGTEQSKEDKQDKKQSKGDEQDKKQSKGDKQDKKQSKGDKEGTEQSKGDKEGTDQSKGDKQDKKQSKGDKEGKKQSKGDKQGTEQSKGDKQGTEQSKGDKQGTEQSKGDKQGTDVQQSKGDKQGTEQSKGDKQGPDAQQLKGDKQGTEKSKGDKEGTDVQQSKGDKEGTDVQQPKPAKDKSLLNQGVSPLKGQPNYEELPREEKIKCVCSFLQQAPAGEFVDVFEDLRILLHDDSLMRNEAAQVCATHTKSNFTMVTIKGETSLVTRYNDLGGNRFFDPQNNLSFRFDHLSGRVDKLLFYNSVKRNDSELWRETLNVALEAYVNEQFVSGECRVYKKTLKNGPFFVVCIESHQYEEFWNCLWKSEWMVPFSPPSTEVRGSISLQIHYFENANLHWTVCKDVEDCIYLMDRDQFALDFGKIIKEEENKFQIDLLETLEDLSNELWRTLRRKLPVTRTVINWDKLLEI